MTVAWTGILNTNPAMCYISVRPERYSYNIIKESLDQCSSFPSNIRKYIYQFLFSLPNDKKIYGKFFDIKENDSFFDVDKIILHHPSTEDIMLMIKLINPKYYMPVKGEYRYMVNNANLANRLGIKAENIILKQNGEVVTIENGKLIEVNN